MKSHFKKSLVALAILGISSPAWSAPKENLMPPSGYYKNAFNGSAYFKMNDVDLKFKKNDYTFTAKTNDFELFDPQHYKVDIGDGKFSLTAKMDSTGNSAKGTFSFFSTDNEPGLKFGPGLLFGGDITDLGWSESKGFLEFQTTNFKGKVCDVGWCGGQERL